MDTLPSPAAPDVRKGFDVSEYSGHDLSFQKLKDEGASFSILRAGADVSRIDRNYDLYFQAAVAADLDIGTYFAFFASSDPEKQACFYASLLKDRFLELPPMIDFELLRGVDPSEAVIRAAAFVQVLESETGAAENSTYVYSYPYFVEMLVTSLKRSQNPAGVLALQKLSKCPLVIAHYDVQSPTVPQPWDDWKIWQCKGNVIRSDGVVDLDLMKGT